MNGLRVLTDPNFSRHIFFIIRRRNRLPIRVRDLPPIDLVLISHGHYDHLSLSTLRKLPRETQVVAPTGLGRILKWAGMKHVVVLRVGEEHCMRDVTVTAVPAQHFRGRPPFFPHTGYQGYVISGMETVYFAGDSGLFGGMAEIGNRWNIDIALLPIGAYQPPPFRRHHMSPEDAIEAAQMLRAKTIVPIHWGTFRLSLEPFDEPIERLLKAAEKAHMSSKLKILEPGQVSVL
ncbi:MAG: MBL fold metallo-hydrolase [Candidatus Lindowbacteria bacterium]|nr:MBL fold metallo-hydrolase [Candidatus Lindowbacteria bacterium]